LNIKEYIKNQLISFDPTLDLSDNGALADLLINPGSAMLDPVIAQLNFLLANLGLGTPEAMNESEFDAIAGNFLKVRKQGAKATGVVELFYNNPINLDIPAGTTFSSSNGIVFVTNQDIHVPLSSMAGNTWNFPRYSTGTVPVVAQEYGVIASLQPNSIKSTNLIPAPALVTNPSAFSGGADKETNTDFAARLIDEAITGALGSASGVRANLSPAFPTIQSITVKGMNDNEMLRDLVYSGLSVYSDYKSIDFYGKVSGIIDSPFPQSIAYYTVFYDDPGTSGLIPDLPMITEFTDEFTTTQYGGIYNLDDALKTSIQTTVVLQDDFQSPKLDSTWVMSDSTTGIGMLRDAEEFLLVTLSGSQMLRLGHRLAESEVDVISKVMVTQNVMHLMLNAIQNMAKMTPTQLQGWQQQISSYTDILNFLAYSRGRVQERDKMSREEVALLKSMTDLAEYAIVEKNLNYYPIISRPLAKHSGVTITGRFQTDDSSTDGKLSYVTILRDGESIDPTNGYGFAWMKNDSTNSIYNVYLVDNSSLANDLFVSPTFIVLPQGENQFKAAAKVDIKANKLYQFKLVVGEDYSMQLKIWANSGSEPALPQLSTGAPTNITANGTHIGFGVMGTENGQWWYDNLLVETTTGVHTAVLYRLKMDPAFFPAGSWAQVNFYGYGYDGTTWGTTAFIKQYVDGEWTWTEMGSNTSTDISDREVTRVSYPFIMGTDYHDTDNFVDILITSTEAQTTVTEVASYYVNLENSIGDGVHTGGCADIYVNDPDSILVAEQTLNNVTGNILMDSANGFLGPLHSMIEVQTALIGDSLSENNDWTLITSNAATAYSTLEYPYLAFAPLLANTKIKVIYRYYAYGQQLQDRLDSDEYRYSGTSNLGKIIPPIIVRINDLRYRGPVSTNQVQTSIATYVNGQTTKITKNDLVSAVYTAGATYVDLTTLDVVVVENNYVRETEDPVNLINEYIKPDLSAFFTDAYEMSGVSKL